MARNLFKNKPGYVLFNSRWHKEGKGATTDPSPAPASSSENMQKSNERDDFSKNESKPISEQVRMKRFEDLREVSLDLEKDLREDLLSESEQDMDWREFLEIFDMYATETDMFDELDQHLEEFIEDFGMFDGSLPNTAMINWRLNRVCKTGDNPHLMSNIQNAVNHYLEGTPISYDIDGEITPEWSSEWGEYPGNVPLIAFSDIVEKGEDIDKLTTIVDALGGRRLYVSTENDNEPDDDDLNTNVMARIIPFNEQGDDTVAHYIVSKEEDDSEEMFYIYTKDATFPAFTYPRKDESEVYSSVDRDREDDMMSKIQSRGSAHRLSQSLCYETMEDVLSFVAQSGECRQAPREEWKKLVSLAQGHVLGGSNPLGDLQEEGSEKEKSREEILFKLNINQMNAFYADPKNIKFDTINTLRGHDRNSEWEHQKVENYASIILDMSRYGAIDIENEVPMNNDSKFMGMVNATKEFAQDSAKSLMREGGGLLDEFRKAPASTTLNTINSVTSALAGRRQLKEEIKEISNERDGGKDSD